MQKIKQLRSMVHVTFRIGWLAACAALAWGQPAPKLNAVSPEWLQRGATADLALAGENLANITGFIVSGPPGLAVTNRAVDQPSVQVETTRGGITSALIQDHNRAKARVELAGTAALGPRELRVVTANGVSNPVLLHVGPLPELVEAEGGKPLEKAQWLPLPAAVTGRIGTAAEVDHYRFKAKKGDHLVFEVYAGPLGSPLDSSLAILNASGKELARNEDANGLDSLLDFEAPEEGEYFVQLRDFRYQGGADYRYRLIAGALPYAKSVFPFGGQRGRTLEVELKGANLGAATKVALAIDQAAPLGWQQIRAHTGAGLSNPFPFDVSDLPDFFEKEPNSAIDQADDIKIPVVVNGRIQGEKDYDAFKFNVDKDQKWIFEIVANRFGSPLDAFLTLTDETGQVLLRNDDALGADARIEFTFSQSGSYLVLVEDLLERNGENYGYRLSIRKPEPDFSVRFMPDTPRVYRGGHVPVRCELSRVSGFDETVRVALAETVPGIYVEPLLLPPGAAAGTLFIAASANAPLGSYPIGLDASSPIGTRPIERAAVPLANDKPVREAFLTVLDSPPFAVELITLSAAAEQTQSAQLDVIVQRHNGFAGEIKIVPEGFSSGRDPISRSVDFQPVTLRGNETRATLKLNVKSDSEIGTRPVWVRADGTAAGVNLVQFSRPIPLTVNEVPFVLNPMLKRISVTALPPGKKSAAAEALFVVKAGRRSGFKGDIGLALEGVPEGIQAVVEKIADNSDETTIKLEATDKAPAGKEFELSLVGNATFNDRVYRYRPEKIKLAVSAREPAGEIKQADAK